MRRTVTSASPYEARYGFSRAVRVGDRLEVAGTAPIGADGGPPPSGPYAQMRRCADIALHAIAELGGEPGDVVRTRMYITDPADADEIGRAHRDAFGAATPAATMVVVASLLDPAWLVEIEVAAVVAGG